jgi:hypothetical protein
MIINEKSFFCLTTTVSKRKKCNNFTVRCFKPIMNMKKKKENNKKEKQEEDQF